MAITEMNQQAAKVLSAEVVADLAILCAKHGLNVKYAGGAIKSDIELELRFKFTVDDPRAVEIAAQQQFDWYAPMHNAVGLYGQEFLYKMERWELIGFYPDSPKFCCKVRKVGTGQIMKFTRDAVRLAREASQKVAA